MNKENQAIISVGSNIEPRHHIVKAIEKIEKRHCLIRQSRIVKTEPIGYKDQPYFLNGAVLIQTSMDFKGLRNWLKKTEIDFGRIKDKNKYGPRIIDLDIVVWNGEVIDSDVYNRSFLKKAIQEISPDIHF